jgi:hypothetical protein
MKEVIDMVYDLHGIDLGRLYATYFAGNGGLVVEANKEALGVLVEAPAGGQGHWLPREGQLLGGEGFCSHWVSCVIVGPPPGSVFALWAEGPLSAHLLSVPTFLSLVLDFLFDKAFCVIPEKLV